MKEPLQSVPGAPVIRHFAFRLCTVEAHAGSLSCIQPALKIPGWRLCVVAESNDWQMPGSRVKLNL